MNHPAIFACLAMVVGLYGFVYLARREGRGPEPDDLLDDEEEPAAELHDAPR